MPRPDPALPAQPSPAQPSPALIMQQHRAGVSDQKLWEVSYGGAGVPCYGGAGVPCRRWLEYSCLVPAAALLTLVSLSLLR